jgi:hypothetical protein
MAEFAKALSLNKVLANLSIYLLRNEFYLLFRRQLRVKMFAGLSILVMGYPL